MNYKYKKRQIFGKRLKVPREILLRIYNCTLSFSEFIEYELDNKVPISCLAEKDRQIVERAGIEKAKTLDWKLLDGRISIKDLVSNWDLYKDKDLSYCLENDVYNEFNITNIQLKEFMKEFGKISKLIIDNTNIYSFIHEINDLKNENKKQEYIRQITDSILERSIKKQKYQEVTELSNDEYKELFKYSSIEEHLKTDSEYGKSYLDKIFKELKTLSQDYIFNTKIPFNILNNVEVLIFIGTYGLKNVIDFDNECGHFFTKNGCEMLKLMYDMYLHYAGNQHDPNKTIYVKGFNGENDYNRPYTKDEFYEAMRRMIIYGPSDWNFRNKAPDYREVIGEFRVRNAQLFISEQAPEELKKFFYAKSITPELLAEHPEYISYLNGKDLGSCFKLREVKVDGSDTLYGYENFYNFLSEKTEFNDIMNFIIEYRDILNIIFDGSSKDRYQYEIKFSKEDDINEIKRKISDTFRRIVIEKGIRYPQIIPQNIIENYPSMFLRPDSPKELQEAFYNRTINTDFILSHPIYQEYLRDTDLEICYKYMPVNAVKKDNTYDSNLISIIKQTFGNEDGFNIMLMYGKYIEAVFEANKLQGFELNLNFSKDDLLDEIDKKILETIIDGKMKYDDKISNHFKNNNPTLFLSENVPQDIRDRFYNRQFTIDDFISDPNLLEVFGDTNIICGLSEDVARMIPLFNDNNNLKEANYKRLKIVPKYLKIQDEKLRETFKKYVLKFDKNIDIEKFEYVSEVLSRISLSNSSEIFTFREELATQILNTINPIKSLNKVEDIFVRNNIPTFGKIYSCFEILHPDFQNFCSYRITISPVLKNTSSTIGKKAIIFSDLIKASFGSNNRSVKKFLNDIEIGTKLYKNIKLRQIQYDTLDELQKNELINFSKILSTLYNNMENKNKDEFFEHTEDVISDISELSKKLSPDGNLDYNLGDRIIRMFCGIIGINTLEQAKNWISLKIENADIRNRNASNSEMILEQGDFIKGIGDITYLRNILQNGSVSKEFLGASATSDATPLDTDVSKIIEADGTIREKMSNTAASGYGPIYFVLKNDDRFITTRTNSKTLDAKHDISKMEVFFTGVLGEDHYGIRTGFSSSEINYIVMENYDERVGLEIAMNGFYIPIANTEGKIIYTSRDYDNIREKMSGLSYYGENKYIFSENLVTSETEYLVSQIEKNSKETQEKRMKIYEVIEKALDEIGLQMKTNISGDLTDGFAELIDTGSTGRKTNVPGEGDFDFMMRLDRSMLISPSKTDKLKQVLLRNFGEVNLPKLTSTGDFRFKGVQIDTETNVDIDITFTIKNDKISYSTDMALQDRLTTIKKINPEKYKYVVANIILAKQVLKEAGVYKTDHSEEPQGGLGGVGIENWILQNGGSFMDAAKSFIEASEGKSFEEFKKNYYIWDFGENHLAERRGLYPYDNFVANNMSQSGYKKMVQTLKEYVKEHSKSVYSLGKESLEEQKNVIFLDEIENDQKRQLETNTKEDNIQMK